MNFPFFKNYFAEQREDLLSPSRYNLTITSSVFKLLSLLIFFKLPRKYVVVNGAPRICWTLQLVTAKVDMSFVLWIIFFVFAKLSCNAARKKGKFQ